MRALLLIAILLVAGCVSDPPAAVPLPGQPASPAEDARLAPLTFREPVSLGWAGRAAEPSIAVAPDGTVYVAAAPQLWRSDDARTFTALGEPVCTLGAPVPSCEGFTFVVAPLDGFRGGDAAIRTDAAGNVYFLGLLGETGTLPFQTSRDRGETWTDPVDLANGNQTDRQWMEVLPNGTLLTTWRDFGRDGDVHQILFRRSGDGGATWDPIRVIGPDPRIQGPLAYDATRGAIFTPVYKDGIRVHRSLDDGITWTSHEVTRESRDTSLRQGRPLDMFPVVTADAGGAVYVAWAAEPPGAAPGDAKHVAIPRVWLASSVDGGETWSEPRALSPEGKVATFPWIVAGDAGRIALTWYEGRAGTPSHNAPDVWDVALVEIAAAASAGPVMEGGFANAAPAHVGGVCRSGGGCVQRCEAIYVCLGQDRSRGEVFEMALRDGHPIVAWVADAAPPTIGIEIHVGGVAEGTPLR